MQELIRLYDVREQKQSLRGEELQLTLEDVQACQICNKFMLSALQVAERRVNLQFILLRITADAILTNSGSTIRYTGH